MTRMVAATESGLASRAVDGLVRALTSLGMEAEAETGAGSVSISWEGHAQTVVVVPTSQMTGAKARQTIADHAGAGVVVADRITADARSLLTASGWSWLDLRGHLHLRGPGLLVDTAVPAQTRPAVRAQPPIRGKAGLAVAYWLCAHQRTALSPTGGAGELGFAPSTISTAVSALADAGLVDSHRAAVLPELFWELAARWQPEWTWLASRPEPSDWSDPERGTSWVRTGDAVAVRYGAPLVTVADGPLDLLVPGAVDVTVAARRYGLARAGTGEAAVAVAPVRQVLVGSGEIEDGWRLAPKLAVALQLATDPARGREILNDWPGDDHAWL
jgi:hypothetical protein